MNNPKPKNISVTPASSDSELSNYIVECIEYFKIGEAARMLQCSAEVLLHLGVRGKVEIMAPVLTPTRFEWPLGGAGLGFPEIEEPFQVCFSAADRVTLTRFDLAKIEAIGWTIPTSFYAPTKARDLIKQVFSFPTIEIDSIQGEPITATYSDQASQEFKIFPSEPESTEDVNIAMREMGYHTLWHEVGSVEHLEDDDLPNENTLQPIITQYVRTEIEHLFVSKSEIHRLRAGLPQDKTVTNRDLEIEKQFPENKIRHWDRHSSAREPMWEAAVYSLVKMLNESRGFPLSAPDLQKKIEISAMTLWQGQLPRFLAFSTMEDQLLDAMEGRMRAREIQNIKK